VPDMTKENGATLAVDVEQLYITYGPMVLRRCRGLLRDEQSAMDAMQDVFVKVLRHEAKMRDEGLSSFLYVTATNTCLNMMRSSKRQAVAIDDEWLSAMADGEDLEGRAMDRIFLERLFDGQKESTKTMAFLHYRDGLTLEETAAATGMSVSGVRKRLRKLRADGKKMAKGGGG
jgi:RNA polymerase sigma-70 factor, ECF subfamily